MVQDKNTCDESLMNKIWAKTTTCMLREWLRDVVLIVLIIWNCEFCAKIKSYV